MASANSLPLADELPARKKDAAAAEHRSVDGVLADGVERCLDDRSWTRLLDYGAERAGALRMEEPDVARILAESRTELRKR